MITRTAYSFLWIFLAILVFFTNTAHAQLATVTSDIDLGTSDSPGIGTGTNTIWTNGTISYASGYSGPAMGTVGSIQINGTIGRRTLISCETSKTMTNVGGTNGQVDRTASPFYLVLGTANAGGSGVGVQCNGVGTAIIDQNLPAGAASTRTILIGMAMLVTDVRNGGQYALSNNAGGELTVRVRQQGGGAPVQIDVTVNASAVFHKDVSISSTTDMDFGTVEYTGSPGAPDTVSLATNGTKTHTGLFTGNATGTPGRVGLSGVNNGTTLQVYCDQSAILTNASGGSINVISIEVDPENSTGAFGTGSSCNGLSGAAATTITYTSGSNDEVFIGGRLAGSTIGGSLGGDYSTANAGGNPIDVTIVIP